MPIKALFNLLDYKKRRIIQLICENIGDSKEFSTLVDPHTVSMHTLLHLTGIARKLVISHLTASKLVKELEKQELVEVYEVGKAKIVIPTQKLKAICEALRRE